MFEFLMLIGFLGAGLSRLLPEREGVKEPSGENAPARAKRKSRKSKMESRRSSLGWPLCKSFKSC